MCTCKSGTFDTEVQPLPTLLPSAFNASSIIIIPNHYILSLSRCLLSLGGLISLSSPLELVSLPSPSSSSSTNRKKFFLARGGCWIQSVMYCQSLSDWRQTKQKKCNRCGGVGLGVSVSPFSNTNPKWHQTMWTVMNFQTMRKWLELQKMIVGT